jgi:NAD-dependent dihydropyrimidine dehydrogenase PreA subunit
MVTIKELKMAIREMVRIDEEKCDGCGLCVPSCAEGAIQIIAGKAKLVADNLCDGLGACLGDCPQGAITIEKREAGEFDELAVDKRLQDVGRKPLLHSQPILVNGGCPSAQVQSFSPPQGGCPSARVVDFDHKLSHNNEQAGQRPSELRQWPVQLHLVPPTAPFLQGKEVLLAADCVAFAYADFHKDLLKDRALLIACPKLDNTAPYLAKLVAMLQQGNIKKLTVAHMEVPCCSGLVALARQAISESGVAVPFATINVGIQGNLK